MTAPRHSYAERRNSDVDNYSVIEGQLSDMPRIFKVSTAVAAVQYL